MKADSVSGRGIWIHGLSGKMGQELISVLASDSGDPALKYAGGSGIETGFSDLKKGLASVDCIVDFSNQAGNLVLQNAVKEAGVRNKVLLIGSTGLGEAQIKNWHGLSEAQGLTLMIAPNTSLGISLALRAALSVAGICSEQGFDIEIEETHHRGKLDAPGGTALYLADHVAKATGLRPVTAREGRREAGELGVHATRGGGVFGEHRIRLLGDFEELSITHRAFSRALFAKGALYLTRWLLSQNPGIYQVAQVYQAKD